MQNERVIDLSPNEEGEVLAIMTRHGWLTVFPGAYRFFYLWDRTIESVDDIVSIYHEYFDYKFAARSYLEVIKNESSPSLRQKIESFLAPRDQKLLRSTREVPEPVYDEIDEFEKPNWWLYRYPLRFTDTYLNDNL